MRYRKFQEAPLHVTMKRTFFFEKALLVVIQQNPPATVDKIDYSLGPIPRRQNIKKKTLFLGRVRTSFGPNILLGGGQSTV